ARRDAAQDRIRPDRDAGVLHRRLPGLRARPAAPATRQPVRGAASGQRADLTGQGEICLGQPASRMRRQRERDLIPGDRDVRMMVRGLSQVGHGAYVDHGVAEVTELDAASYRLTRSFPASNLTESGGDLVF